MELAPGYSKAELRGLLDMITVSHAVCHKEMCTMRCGMGADLALGGPAFLQTSTCQPSNSESCRSHPPPSRYSSNENIFPIQRTPELYSQCCYTKYKIKSRSQTYRGLSYKSDTPQQNFNRTPLEQHALGYGAGTPKNRSYLLPIFRRRFSGN